MACFPRANDDGLLAMNRVLSSIAVLLGIVAVWGVRADFVYTVDFNGTNLDSRLYVVDSPPFGTRLSGSQVELYKDEGADAFSGEVNIYFQQALRRPMAAGSHLALGCLNR